MREDSLFSVNVKFKGGAYKYFFQCINSYFLFNIRHLKCIVQFLMDNKDPIMIKI